MSDSQLLKCDSGQWSQITLAIDVTYFKTEGKVKVKVKVTLEQAAKAQWGSRCIALLFLQPRR